MQSLFIVLLCFALGYIIVQLWQLVVLYNYKNAEMSPPENWPMLSVLIAARDEEDNIAQCLQALLNQDYPPDRLEIIVGNDQSTDNTRSIVLEFAKKNPQIKCVDVVEKNNGLKAKARVMAQLDEIAIGDFYLITDADVCVKKTWVKSMLLQMRDNMGVASGTTMVTGKGSWAHLQKIDWAYFMGLLNVISYSGVPATAVGNNMIVRKKAYWETGGYSKIQFSITEDYKLYSEICKKGWHWNNVMSPNVLAYSLPTRGFLPLLHQRKRWLSGGKELPYYWWLLFGIFGLYYFIVPVGFILNPLLFSIAMLIKLLLQIMQINQIYKHIGEKRENIASHLMYELYLFVVTTFTALFFVLPIKTIWKGRKY